MVDPSSYRRHLPEPPPVSQSNKKKTKKKNKKNKSKSNDVEHILMISKYANTCLHCKNKVKVGDKIWWSSKTHKVIHFGCFEPYVYGRKK